MMRASITYVSRRSERVFFGITAGLLLILRYLLTTEEWGRAVNDLIVAQGEWISVFISVGFMVGLISQRGLRENEWLENSPDLIREMAEISLTGVYLFQNGRFEYVNPRFSEILGYSRSELEEMDAWEIIHPEDRERVKDITFNRESGGGSPAQCEARMVTSDGETLWVEIRTSVIQYNGAPAILGNFVDITARKEREESDLRHKSEIDLAKRYIEDVLKNNYQVIDGYAESMTDDRARTVVKRMVFEGTEFIENIETFFMLRETPPGEAVQRLCLATVIDQSVEYVRARTSAEILREGDDPHVLVLASPYLWRALVNLIVNGVLHGSGAPVVIRTSVGEEYALLSVVNRGDPIPVDLIRSLREDYGTGRGGSGFGLKLATEILSSDGCSWWIESGALPGGGEGIVSFNAKFPIAKLNDEEESR